MTGKIPLPNIILRNVIESDLPILFQQQADTKAAAMAGFPSRDKGPFMVHWEGILKNKTVIARTILFKGKLAGHIICWKQEYEQTVGYWLGREFWGKGIASRALAEFLKEMKIRPLYAHVALNNIASKRVLEKCGFEILDEGEKEFLFRLND
jgi:RimJ/RimL family protein N-acetyltransferase